MKRSACRTGILVSRAESIGSGGFIEADGGSRMTGRGAMPVNIVG